MESIFKLGILLSVIDKVTGPASRIGRGVDALRKKTLSLGPAFEKFKSYGIKVAAGGALMIALLSGTVMATAATQKALGELSSVGITDLATLEAAGASFSNKWAGTTKAEFIAAAYDIKSGISSLTDTGVAEFTKLAALTGKATKSTTAEMTSLFATSYGVYKNMYSDLSDIQFGEMFSAGIAASVKQFKTTGSGMAASLENLGAAATVVKRPMEEQLAVLGMLQATMSASEAGTGYKAVIRDVAKAGKALGLNFYDANDNLKSMPQILTLLEGKFGNLKNLTGVQAANISDAFGEESYKAISQLYGKTGDLTSNIQSLSVAMKQGTGFTEKMAMAMNQDIGSGIALLGQQWHNLVEVIGKQFIPLLIPLFTWVGNIILRLKLFAENHKYLTRVMVIGVGIIAALAFTLGSLAAVLGVVGLMVPNVISGIGQVRGAFVFLKTSILGAIPAMRKWLLWQKQSLLTFLYQQGGIKAYAKTLATAPLAAAKTAITATKAWIISQYKSLAATIANAGGIRAYAMSMGTSFLASMGAAITAVWSFTAALLANPITWIVIGIAALGGVLYFLYKKFETVRTVIDGFMYTLGYMVGTVMRVGKGFLTALLHPITFVKSLFWGAGQVIGWLVEKFMSVVPALKGIAKTILSFAFPPLAILFNWDTVKNGVSAMLNWIKGLFPKFLEAGRGLWNALVEGIKSVIMKPVELVKKGLSFVRNLLPFSDAKEGPLSQLTLSGSKIMETLGAGVQASAPVLQKAVAGALAGVMIASPAIAKPDIPGELAKPVQTAIIRNAAIEPPVIPDLTNEIQLRPKGGLEAGKPAATVREHGGSEKTEKTVIIHLHNITLPNVSNGEDFVEQLKRIEESHDA